MDLSRARTASRIKAAIRSFFDEQGFTEVETPILSPAVIPESPIEYFETFHIGREGEQIPLYLLPSPELYMKKLIAGGSGDIFQLVRSFRNGGESGSIHNPEFTMLEWYEVGSDYMDSISVTEELFDRLAYELDTFPAELPRLCGKELEKLRPPFERISVREAVLHYAGVDIGTTQSRGELAAAVEDIGLGGHSAYLESDSWEQLFNRILLNRVEPNLPNDRPLILYDYPAQIPALAKRSREGPWLERWELYFGGLELANCYSEETDPRIIDSFFEREYAAKAAASPVVPDMDEKFLSIFDSFPPCSGVAMGVDRLVMLLSGADSIEGVILFPISDILRR